MRNLETSELQSAIQKLELAVIKQATHGTPEATQRLRDRLLKLTTLWTNQTGIEWQATAITNCVCETCAVTYAIDTMLDTVMN